VYTVPAGKRTIVKNVILQNNAAAANRAILGIYNGATVLAAWGLTPGPSASLTETLTYDSWFVMNAGETLKVSAAASSLEVIVSGAELIL
jgi:phosphoribosylformylglycinamidine (FGAM) synthase-like amidotransferase family enzyme